MTPGPAPSRPSGGSHAGRRFAFTSPRVAVTTADESAARDAAAIASGIPSRALMRAAGLLAAAEIARRYQHRLHRGVAVFAGPGNNGGDAWVVAGALAATGVGVRVLEVAEAKSPDAIAERAAAIGLIDPGEPHGGEEVIVDGILGTGARGVPAGTIADAITLINRRRSLGAAVVALDVPSGLHASSGDASGAVTADLTLTFGTIKRGLLVARGTCGAIVVLDIGLGAPAPATPPRRKSGSRDTASRGAESPILVDARWVLEHLPPIGADAHKGSRGKIAIVGGAPGMSGAVIMAARAALAAGAGMVKVVAHADSLATVTAAVPEALTAPWPKNQATAAEVISSWADVMLIGPGLGASQAGLVGHLLAESDLRAVLDADALNAFAGRAAELGKKVGTREALLTPHATECARLAGVETDDVLARRFEVGAELARDTRAAVLLKGVPTGIASPTGERLATATGTPALATGGSGDVLGGVAAVLLAQGMSALHAGALAAYVHGRAAELAQGARPVRGTVLDDVLVALPSVWDERPGPPRAPVLVELPAVRLE
ncbi:MAG: NAD(P)H-hydrate dehydratase [Gemmatimonadetes bacterium]|nr:NAD(P)H-hydrate dehydratase [Gemmatimonadota bacterium]